MPAYYIFGRRDGFNSTAALQDVGQFLGATDAFPELTGAESLEIVSSSANDSAAGTGTRTVQVTYLDTGNNLQVSSPVAMNGTAAVALPFNAKFIYWIESVTGGTLDGSAGTIDLRIAGGGAVQERVQTGGNRSTSARFMVPAGYSASVLGWQASSVGAATMDVFLRATAFADRSLASRFQLKDNVFITANSNYSSSLSTLLIPSLAKIKISALPSAVASSNRINASFSLLLQPN